MSLRPRIHDTPKTDALVALVCLLAVALISAQPLRPSQARALAEARRVVALPTVGHTVEDLDRAVTFYRQVFGFVPFGPVGRPIVDEFRSKLFNTPNARYRDAVLKLPNTGFLLRLVEFTGIDRTPGKPRFTEPGQTDLLLTVGDLDVALLKLQQVDAEVLTAAGKPVSRGDAVSSVFTRDPDGYTLEMVSGASQLPLSSGASFVVGTRVAMTAGSTDAKLAFYRDLLGLDVTTEMWTGMPGGGRGEVRRSDTKTGIGDLNTALEIYEFRGVPEKAVFRPRIQDPSAGMVSFLVKDLDQVVTLVKAAHLPFVTTGGEPISGPLNSRRIVIQDPDGVFIELIQQ